MSNITLIVNTVALWVIVVCQILEIRQFIRSRKDMGELIKKMQSYAKRMQSWGWLSMLLIYALKI